jgi:alkanesulfonate monooxygenase SsuD/methylene tetrahydromethanopterin reductase-like flavin-dependent oxidoreductase (luciferase family)
MVKNLKFGIFDQMEFNQASLGALYEERLQMLEYADGAGFWCYHKSEHHFIPLDAAPSANVFLAAASQRTSSIRLGSLVYLLPFYNPIRLIEEICTLDHLCRGRLEVGVGKGISPAEHTLWGRDPEGARSRFEETFEILRLGLSSETIHHKGTEYHYDGLVVPHRPKQRPHPAIWYPGNFNYAGQHRLNTVVGGPADLVAQSIQSYKSLVANPIKDWNPGVTEPIIGATRHIYVAASREQARDRVTTAYPKYHQNLSTLFKKHDIPFANGDPSLGGNVELALSVGALIAGSPDDVVDHIKDLVTKTSVDYLMLAFAWGDLQHQETMASMHLFVDEVMPRFKQ